MRRPSLHTAQPRRVQLLVEQLEDRLVPGETFGAMLTLAPGLPAAVAAIQQGAGAEEVAPAAETGSSGPVAEEGSVGSSDTDAASLPAQPQAAVVPAGRDTTAAPVQLRTSETANEAQPFAEVWVAFSEESALWAAFPGSAASPAEGQAGARDSDAAGSLGGQGSSPAATPQDAPASGTAGGAGAASVSPAPAASASHDEGLKLSALIATNTAAASAPVAQQQVAVQPAASVAAVSPNAGSAANPSAAAGAGSLQGGDNVQPLDHVHSFSGPGPSGYSPAQIRQAYGFNQLSGTGAGQTIAIVDAYNDPSIKSDLATFDSTFGLTPLDGKNGDGTFTVVNQNGGTRLPKTNSGWALEISLDVEWAHALAPQANILLVEASTSSFSNLLSAVDYASAHAHVVSMSWGGSEFSSESSYDYHFNKSGVVFTAASGDNGTGVIYPAASPYVVSVGGTTLPLDSSGNLTGAETAWSGSGGGISAVEGEPGYQSSYGISATGRGVPDVAYDANPNTGFAVYDSTSYYGQKGWFVVGGTSAGAPQWAALFALADAGRSTPLSSNNLSVSAVYAAATGSTTYASNFNDITSGSNGTGPNTSAGTGYDFVTGLGSPQANNLVTYLQTH